MEIRQISCNRRPISDLIPAHPVSDYLIASRPSSCRVDRDYWLIANSKRFIRLDIFNRKIRSSIMLSAICSSLDVSSCFLWNGQELSETISEDKWVRNTGLQISSLLFCRTIRRSCGLILPNDTLKQFDHNQLVNNRVQVSDGAQKIILERTKELPLRPCGCPLFAL